MEIANTPDSWTRNFLKRAKEEYLKVSEEDVLRVVYNEGLLEGPNWPSWKPSEK